MNSFKLNQPITLSVLVPAYNVDKYIIYCLNSIDEQLTDECEIIVYDDGSTDSTVEIIKSSPLYQKPNFRFVQGEINKGLSFARNTLKDISQGEYIWFMDSDDKILEGAIGKILNCIHASNPDTIFFNYNVWPEILTKRDIRKGLEKKSYTGPLGSHQTNHTTAFVNTMRSRNLHAWSKVFRKSLFSADTKFPEGRIFEDINVIPLLASLTRRAHYINEPLVAYRKRPGSILSSMRPANEIESLISSHNLRERYIKIHGSICEDALRALTYFSSRQLRGAIRNIVKTAPPQQQPQLLDKALRVFQEIHGRDFLYIMRTCYQEEGIALCFHISKRIFQARRIIKRL